MNTAQPGCVSNSTGEAVLTRPRRRSRRRAGRAVLRMVLGLGLLAWLVVGVLGLWRYIDGYVVYRGFPPPVTPQGVASGRLETIQFFSPALQHQSSALVYVPPGYAQAAAKGRRFGVMYLLHGSPGKAANLFNAGAAARDANVLIHTHRIRPMLLVAPSGLQGFGGDMEWANGRVGPYENYLLDVVRATDARFATVPDRAHRVLAGDSEGGFGAANVALHHLSAFGGFQSWSGYFTQQPQGTFTAAPPATLAANSPTEHVARLAPQIRRLGLHAFVYAGTHDAHGVAQMRQFVAALGVAGATVGSGAYPGGHDWGLWRAQMPRMLTIASGWMSGAGGQARMS
jgi:enterochelin esterase-like enzyme